MKHSLNILKTLMMMMAVAVFISSCSSSQQAQKAVDHEFAVQTATPAMDLHELPALEPKASEVAAAEVSVETREIALAENKATVKQEKAARTFTEEKAESKVAITLPNVLKKPAQKLFKKQVSETTAGTDATNLSTGLLIMLIGLALLVIAVILVAAGGLGGFLISGLLWAIGGILLTVGLVVWIVEMVS